MDSLGKRLVRALVSEQNLAKLSELGVDEHDVFDDARKALLWATDFLRTKGQWPTTNQVEENTKIELPDVPDDLSYICDIIRKRSLGKALDGRLKDVLKQLEDREPDEALRLMGETAAKLRTVSTSKARVESFRKRGPDRYQEYVDLKNLGGLRGVATPWAKLDKAIHGWIDGTLNVIIAVQNVGKSWGCCLIAEHALQSGKKVLFVTLEMASLRIGRRLDALHYVIPAGDLIRSEVDLFREDRWKNELIQEVMGCGDILIVDKHLVRYVGDATALAMEYKPDLVVIDGGYRFLAKRVQGDWESAKMIVAELQTTAEATNVPWIVTSQQGDVSGRGRLDNQERAFKVKYAKEWVINPDNVIEMVQNDDLRLMRQMEWRLLKIRDDPGEGDRESFKTQWDMQAMNFDQIDDGDVAEIAVTY